ncbi:EAL domain-containing protein [Paenibacillus chartarius]|uniref:EAL domain-containing protein n=1 Tax=Paenibacillus chartarius TaxID=747481 RepID=A0ABV6DTJ2_9BACL
MRLLTKIMIYISLSTVILLTIQYTLSERLIIRNSEVLEMSYAKEGLKRALHSFFDENRNLGAIAINYAGWDDTYHFVSQAHIPPADVRYIQTNYPPSLFTSSRLNFALLFDNDKRVFLGKSYDFMKNEATGDSAAFIEELRGRHASFIEHADESSRKVAIIVVNGKPIVAVSDPILTSENKGPVHGSLVFGRYIDDHYIRYVSEKADMSLSYRIVNSSLKLPEHAVKMTVDSKELSYWAETDRDYIRSFAAIYDVDNNPVVVLECAQPRDFSKQALASIRYYSLYYALSGLALLVVVIIVLKRNVFHRMYRAVSGMNSIEREHNFSLRIAETGQDELSDMERTFNRMMASLERKQLEIYHQAHHDVLTGLPNRKSFFLMLEEKMDYGRQYQVPFAVLFIDLDRFKYVNDTFGHHAGDRLLVQAANRIKDCLLHGDALFRLGGDEFCVICQNEVDTTAIEKLIGRIKSKLDTPFHLEGQAASISASIGISLYPEHGTNGEELLLHADTAMLAVKDSGRAGYLWYSESIHAARKRRLTIENYLPQAIDHNELLLHYQPKWDLKRNEMTGVEALLRWNHSQLGAVPPSEFIPIAESSGLITVIGDWILRSVCRQYKEWQISVPGNTWSIAVNISGMQLLEPDFVERVRTMIEEEEVEPSRIEFEVTESFAITNFVEVSRVLMQLSELGILISIDDFGAGYSSLKYLCKLPIQIMKIDKSLVEQVYESVSHQVVLSSVIDMAHQLGLIVVAEGVETEEQLRFLRDQGCDRIQGYLVGRPVSAERIVKKDFAI